MGSALLGWTPAPGPLLPQNAGVGHVRVLKLGASSVGACFKSLPVCSCAKGKVSSNYLTIPVDSRFLATAAFAQGLTPWVSPSPSVPCAIITQGLASTSILLNDDYHVCPRNSKQVVDHIRLPTFIHPQALYRLRVSPASLLYATIHTIRHPHSQWHLDLLKTSTRSPSPILISMCPWTISLPRRAARGPPHNPPTVRTPTDLEATLLQAQHRQPAKAK